MRAYRTLAAVVIGIPLVLALPSPASARFRVPLPPAPVTISHHACPGTRPADAVICTDTDQGVVFYPWHIRVPRFVLAHELGHLFDVRVLTDTDRSRFARLLRASDPAWADQTGGDCAAGECASEMFADAYANCAIGGVPGVHRENGHRVWDWHTAYGYEPTKRRHRRVCRMIRRLGASRALPRIAVWRTAGR